ncbi:MAG: hypothetical protein O3B84_06080, partial [Chloroflexi bacterium]|nr:hypothetical protein [Chloroflexota bacterium]
MVPGEPPRPPTARLLVMLRMLYCQRQEEKIEDGDSLCGGLVDQELRKQIIEQYRAHATDSGSTSLQVALL